MALIYCLHSMAKLPHSLSAESGDHSLHFIIESLDAPGTETHLAEEADPRWISGTSLSAENSEVAGEDPGDESQRVGG